MSEKEKTPETKPAPTGVGVEPLVVPSFSWACIYYPNNSTVPMNGLWGYGQIVDDSAMPYGKRMENIQARIERQKDGRWFYIVFGHPTQQGAEPSKAEAMKACEYWIRHNM